MYKKRFQHAPWLRERVGNMDEVKSRKEVIKSNIETKDEKVGGKGSYSDISSM